MRQIDFYELSDYTREAVYQINNIYLHWTAGRYDQAFGAYHINIDDVGNLWTDMDSLLDYKSHTWRRNSNSIGIALDCALGSSIDTNGNVRHQGFPPTDAQLDMMSKVVAKLCIELGVPISSYRVMTHAEVADIDGYGIYGDDPDMRWDLYGLGDSIRARAMEYAHEWGL
ncbi:peptidoglycan recognition protein family protein [Veillonella intestinalis]|uniref:peptidoglycan recognition protein family protein n=1 Tax=Veillonella intestinalis TaxID=2941341 RepID=UPI00203D51C7|nr:N-acetylmuramoyl-L-alanine amidase [Veillonella intestinalis]